MSGLYIRPVSRKIARGILVVAAVIGVQVTWHNVFKDRFVPKRFAEVLPDHLYRSGQISEYLIRDVLTEHEIGVVIDLNPHEEKWLIDQLAEEQAVRDLEIEHLRLPLRGDGTGDLAAYARAITEIQRAKREGKAILVHCAAGARRTGGVVAAYLLLVDGAPRDVVISELGRHGSGLVDSNLLTFMNASMRPLARMLVDAGVIDAVPKAIPHLGP